MLTYLTGHCKLKVLNSTVNILTTMMNTVIRATIQFNMVIKYRIISLTLLKITMINNCSIILIDMLFYYLIEVAFAINIGPCDTEYINDTWNSFLIPLVIIGIVNMLIEALYTLHCISTTIHCTLGLTLASFNIIQLLNGFICTLLYSTVTYFTVERAFNATAIFILQGTNYTRYQGFIRINWNK